MMILHWGSGLYITTDVLCYVINKGYRIRVIKLPFMKIYIINNACQAKESNAEIRQRITKNISDSNDKIYKLEKILRKINQDLEAFKRK
jgi:hypothetical protein